MRALRYYVKATKYYYYCCATRFPGLPKYTLSRHGRGLQSPPTHAEYFPPIHTHTRQL